MVVGALVVVAWLVWTSRGALFPFALGLLFSYLVSPIVNRVQTVIPDRGWLGRSRRALAVTIVYLTALLAIVALVATIVPRVVSETVELVENLPEYADDARQESDYWNDRYEEAIPEDIRQRIEENVDQVGSVVGDAAVTALTAAFGTVRRVIGFIAGLLLLPLWTFYVLKDQRRGMDYLYGLFPPGIQHDVRNIVGIADRVLGAYVRGQIILGFIIGLVTFIGLYLLDVPYAVPLAVLAGIFEMVPILGPWISGVTGVIVVLATEPSKIWVVIVFFVMIQQLENTFLVPKVQGDAVDMNPAVIMVLLVVGGAVFGILGVIVIVPLAAIARDIFVYVYARLSEEGNLSENSSV
jgi:predicted PurR-regulated permease PerM